MPGPVRQREERADPEPALPERATPERIAAKRAAPARGAELSLREEKAGALSPEHAGLVEKLLDWFAKNQRDLPWRRDYDPYAIWISEIMLQQTQAGRAALYFSRWMERFPTLRSVAEAHLDDVLKAWEGLGYYSRAKRLHQAARAMERHHHGRVPDSLPALKALPGIGEYTAGAILSIARNQPHAAVDANVERVFARLFDVGAPVKSAVAAGFIRDMAEALLPEGRARDFNQALMDFGALVCRKTPDCPACPVRGYCQAHRLGIVAERPVPGRKVQYSALEIVSGLLLHKGRVFLQKRLDSGVWAGLWEFPGGRLEKGESPEQAIVREFQEETAFTVRPLSLLGIVRHAYTRYRIVMHAFLLEMEADPSGPLPKPCLSAATEYCWARPGELGRFTMPAGHRKLVDAWLPEIERAVAEL